MADENTSPTRTIEGAWRGLMQQLAVTNLQQNSTQQTALRHVRAMWGR